MKNKKTGLSILMIMLSIVMLCVSVIMVYSASSHTVRGTLSVSYQANNVAATVSAKFQIAETVSATDMTTTGSAGDATSITFAVSESEPLSGTLSYNNDININDDQLYVLFTYTFHNDATNGADPFDVSLRNGMSGSAFTVKYHTDTAAYDPTSSDSFNTKYNAVKNSGVSSTNSLGNEGKVSVAAGSTVYIYILIEATVLSENATYSDGGITNNNVSFTLNHASST